MDNHVDILVDHSHVIAIVTGQFQMIVAMACVNAKRTSRAIIVIDAVVERSG